MGRGVGGEEGSSPGKYNIRSQFTFMCGNYKHTRTVAHTGLRTAQFHTFL